MQARTIPSMFTLRSEPVTMTAAAEGRTPRFSMVLNSGKPFNGWGFNAILDMDGCEIPASQRMPMLRQHDGGKIAGQSDKITKAVDGLRVEGEVYPETAAGLEVLTLSAKKFEWKASFGVQPHPDGASFEWVGHDEQKTVNGHVFSDGLIIRRSLLKEGSFVAIGADSETSAIAASPNATLINLPARSQTMDAKPATLTELRAAFPDAEDREFVLEQREAEATLAQAQIAHAAVLKTRIAALKAEMAKPVAPAASAPRRQPVAVGAAPVPETLTASQRWLAALDAARKTLDAEGKPLQKGAAVAMLAAANPELHQAYLAEVNGGRTIDQAGLRRKATA